MPIIHIPNLRKKQYKNLNDIAEKEDTSQPNILVILVRSIQKPQ